MGFRGEPFRGSFFKTPITPKVKKVTAQRKGKAEEDKEMRAARQRDGWCRFPNCKCRDYRLVLDVAHFEQHRGMGGNPSRDRTVPERLILLCRARHRSNRVSVDRGTLRILPLDKKLGAGGPCAFQVDMRAFTLDRVGKRPRWFEIGRETERHLFEPFTPEQLEVFDDLKGMEL